jgi:tetratricopeptide (TPR) repeat protein
MAKELCLLACLATTAVSADQRDPRLDDLFQLMKQTTSLEVAADAENRIWQIWLQHEDDEIEARLNLATLAMDQNSGRALQGLTELIDDAPDFAEAWNKRATLYYLLGDYTASAADIKRTLALEPRHFGALSGLGLVHLAMKEYVEAKDAFEAVLKIHPNNRSAQQNLEMLNRYMRRFTV